MNRWLHTCLIVCDDHSLRTNYFNLHLASDAYNFGPPYQVPPCEGNSIVSNITNPIDIHVEMFRDGYCVFGYVFHRDNGCVHLMVWKGCRDICKASAHYQNLLYTQNTFQALGFKQIQL